MKYDDASWHSEGDFPEDLPGDAAFTHTGLYLAWAVRAGLASEELQNDFVEELAKLGARLAPPCHLYKVMDGKLTEEDLSDEGNSFTKFYFDFDVGQYLNDYGHVFGEGHLTMYHVADSWENYEKLKPILDNRLAAWRADGIELQR
jgi:hypothetical protein